MAVQGMSAPKFIITETFPLTLNGEVELPFH